MLEFKVKRNNLYLTYPEGETIYYTSFVRIIHDFIFHSFWRDRSKEHNEINDDFKKIMEQYEEEGLEFVRDTTSSFFIHRIFCYNEPTQRKLVDDLNAYVIMRRLTK